MSFKLTKYGYPQIIVFAAVVAGIMISIGFLGLHICLLCNLELILGLILICGLLFFRDPDREIPPEKNLILASADGTVADIEKIAENDFINGEALRIGIFLNIFNVHINRAPCNVQVENILYKKGSFKDARSNLAGKVNESNELWLKRTDEPQERLIVRQISGAIARRIVCQAKKGQNLAAGERFGMIKFGSRTEVYLPVSENLKCVVKKGDKVKAGLTVIAKYENSNA